MVNKLEKIVTILSGFSLATTITLAPIPIRAYEEVKEFPPVKEGHVRLIRGNDFAKVQLDMPYNGFREYEITKHPEPQISFTTNENIPGYLYREKKFTIKLETYEFDQFFEELDHTRPNGLKSISDYAEKARDRIYKAIPSEIPEIVSFNERMRVEEQIRKDIDLLRKANSSIGYKNVYTATVKEYNVSRAPHKPKSLEGNTTAKKYNAGSRGKFARRLKSTPRTSVFKTPTAETIYARGANRVAGESYVGQAEKRLVRGAVGKAGQVERSLASKALRVGGGVTGFIVIDYVISRASGGEMLIEQAPIVGGYVKPITHTVDNVVGQMAVAGIKAVKPATQVAGAGVELAKGGLAVGIRILEGFGRFFGF